MFSKYTVLFAFLAFFAIQSTNGLHVQRLDERSIGDLIEKAKEAIQRLRDIVDAKIKEVLQKIEAIKDKILNKAKEIVDHAKEDIANIIKGVKDQMQHMKEEADKLGVDVKECFIENESELQQIPKKTIDKLIKCITGKVSEATDIIKDIVNEIIGIKDQLVNLPTQLKECMASGKVITCLKQLISDVVSSISSIPTLIQDKVNELLKLVANIEADLKSCALQKVIEAGKDAAVVGAKVAKCVADKINE